MKTNNALQVIFAFFLGLVVVAFVGIGVNTFYPEPSYSYEPGSNHSVWQLTTGLILLGCATVLLAVSLFLGDDKGALSNGILLGGVFTMIYSVGITVSSETSVVRFLVIAVALAVTIVIGYLKFVRGRGRRRTAVAVPAAGEPAAGAVTGAVAGQEQGELAARLAAVERKLDALARALQQ